HHAWNANPQKRPTRGLAASLFLAERYGLLVEKGFAGAVPAEVRSVTAHRRHCCDCTNVPCGAAPRTRGSLMSVPNFTQRQNRHGMTISNKQALRVTSPPQQRRPPPALPLH